MPPVSLLTGGCFKTQEQKMKRSDLIQDSLEISVRLWSLCRAANIKTFGELVDTPTRDLLKLRGFGKVTLAEIDNIRSRITR